MKFVHKIKPDIEYGYGLNIIYAKKGRYIDGFAFVFPVSRTERYKDTTVKNVWVRSVLFQFNPYFLITTKKALWLR